MLRVGGVQVRWVVAAALALSACAKGQIGGGNNSTFGVGMGTSVSSTDGSGGDTDRDDETGGGKDSSDPPTTTDEPTTGGASNDETCGVACSESCGNGTIEAGEDCDGVDLGGMDCVAVGFAGGTLACNGCTFDTSACADAVCGDGVIGGTEECDCAGGACTAAGLQNQTCTGLPAPTGGNYSGGTLSCDGSCTFDDSGCWACGDGAVNEGEQCDGGSLNGATCQSQGFDDGTLSCSGGCTFDTGGCVDWVCGNGVCEPNEDSCNCSSDCPDDPNSCSTCECGGFGGACFCDAVCVEYGDCCSNGPC
jgi:hypothetical protein